MKTCPFCAEEIQDAAVKCKHCGSELEIPWTLERVRERVRQLKTERVPAPAAAQTLHLEGVSRGQIVAAMNGEGYLIGRMQWTAPLVDRVVRKAQGAPAATSRKAQPPPDASAATTKTSPATWGCLVLILLFAFGGGLGSLFESDAPPGSGASPKAKPKPKPKAEIHPEWGPKPRQSEWDGDVPEVKSWLNANLKDPDSLDIVEWSPVFEVPGQGWGVRCKYRAKNSFGANTIENKVFVIRHGRIVKVQDFLG